MCSKRTGLRTAKSAEELIASPPKFIPAPAIAILIPAAIDRTKSLGPEKKVPITIIPIPMKFVLECNKIGLQIKEEIARKLLQFGVLQVR